jgi:hypothetical protein
MQRSVTVRGVLFRRQVRHIAIDNNDNSTTNTVNRPNSIYWPIDL